MQSHWVYSITTRIKTPLRRTVTASGWLIEYIPLQQGLRHEHNSLVEQRSLIEYIPLQQGLRPYTKSRKNSNKTLIEYIPLQQGLRLCKDNFIKKRWLHLIEYIPLQQGLRLQQCLCGNIGKFSHWVYSITTRIKTFLLHEVYQKSPSHWVYSITTRIKTLKKVKEEFYYNPLIEYIQLQQGLRL